MTEADRVVSLAYAIDAARRAYLDLGGGAALPDDVTLARSTAYRTLLTAGRQIRTLSTRDTFLRMKSQLFADPELSARAASDLDYLWAGLSDWPDNDPVRVRLH